MWLAWTSPAEFPETPDLVSGQLWGARRCDRRGPHLGSVCRRVSEWRPVQPAGRRSGRLQDEGRVSGSSGAVAAHRSRPAAGPIHGWRVARRRGRRPGGHRRRALGFRLGSLCGAVPRAKTAPRHSQAGKYDSDTRRCGQRGHHTARSSESSPRSLTIGATMIRSSCSRCSSTWRWPGWRSRAARAGGPYFVSQLR